MAILTLRRRKFRSDMPTLRINNGREADHGDLKVIEERMRKCSVELLKMSDDVADALTVKSFSSERHKRALAIVVAEHLAADGSAAAAEYNARASAAYGSQLHDLTEQYRSAMRVLEKADAIKTMFESARSMMAMERQRMGLL